MSSTPSTQNESNTTNIIITSIAVVVIVVVVVLACLYKFKRMGRATQARTQSSVNNGSQSGIKDLQQQGGKSNVGKILKSHASLNHQDDLQSNGSGGLNQQQSGAQQPLKHPLPQLKQQMPDALSISKALGNSYQKLLVGPQFTEQQQQQQQQQLQQITKSQKFKQSDSNLAQSKKSSQHSAGREVISANSIVGGLDMPVPPPRMGSNNGTLKPKNAKNSSLQQVYTSTHSIDGAGGGGGGSSDIPSEKSQSQASTQFYKSPNGQAVTAMAQKPIAVDLSDAPKTSLEIRKAKGMTSRFMFGNLPDSSIVGGDQTNTHSVNPIFNTNDFSSDMSQFTIMSNILSGYQTTFRDDEETVINSAMPFAIPADRLMTKGLDYQLGNVVAKGGTSTIYMAELSPQNAALQSQCRWGVVAKVIQESDLMQQDDIFNQELAIMSDLANHQNFVKLLGFSHSPKCILMPYYKFGSLKDLINKTGAEIKLSDQDWNMYFMRAVLLDIASAVSHLHSKKISHNDLKPENILLDLMPNNSLICLLADFSISTITSDDRMGVKAMKKSQIAGLSMAYAAPEYVKAFFEYKKILKTNPNADMVPVQAPLHSRDSYAYGISCYEIICRGKAYDGLTRDDIRHVVQRGQRPLFPDSILNLRMSDRNWGLLCNICESCWSSDMNFRLTMEDVIRRLLSIKL
ncbi:hypothetical protein MP228_007337 [Amoeboaphelidium protococcarum]|nr:hypothetical protein MP228_007337 [Amoeboaphelidium protococcarum]